MKALWIGDGGTSTGFSKVCHEIGSRLEREYDWDIDVLAMGWDGKRPASTELRLWGAGPNAGFGRVTELLKKVEPDIVILNEDIPFVLRRLLTNPFDKKQLLLRGPWKVVAYVPLDGDGLPPSWYKLKELVEVIPYTKFGADQLGLDRWIHHGVNTHAFHPVSDETPLMGSDGTFYTNRVQIREAYDLDPDTFVIGRVDTNSGRKDWPSTWRIVEIAHQELLSVTALWHTRIKFPGNGVNIGDMVSRGQAKVMVTDAEDWPQEDVAVLMNAFDIVVSTTRGEGWWLGGAEALASGVPVLGPNHSSLPEVVGPGAVLVDPVGVITSPYGHDLRLPDVDTMGQQLVQLAREPDRLRGLATAGLEHVRGSFSWDTATRQLHEFCSSLEAPHAMEHKQPA